MAASASAATPASATRKNSAWFIGMPPAICFRYSPAGDRDKQLLGFANWPPVPPATGIAARGRAAFPRRLQARRGHAAGAGVHPAAASAGRHLANAGARGFQHNVGRLWRLFDVGHVTRHSPLPGRLERRFLHCNIAFWAMPQLGLDSSAMAGNTSDVDSGFPNG